MCLRLACNVNRPSTMATLCQTSPMVAFWNFCWALPLWPCYPHLMLECCNVKSWIILGKLCWWFIADYCTIESLMPWLVKPKVSGHPIEIVLSIKKPTQESLLCKLQSIRVGILWFLPLMKNESILPSCLSLPWDYYNT